MTVLTLQRFLVQVRDRLEAMTAEQMRAALLAHAATLPGTEREAFLRIFATAPAPIPQAPAASVTPQDTWPVEDDRLLADIDAFADSIRSGTYAEGSGFDPEIRDYRTFGDESWTDEMDALFTGAQQAFLGGQLGLARAAYRRLFEVFDLEEEPDTFPGDRPAVDMVGTDIAEAQARYLRAVCETTPVSERAGVLAEEWFDLPTWQPPSLAAVREALPYDLPELKAFLPGWITALRSMEGGQGQVRGLLAEATELHAGADGLGSLAHQTGVGQAERYLDWVQALGTRGPQSAGRAGRPGGAGGAGTPRSDTGAYRRAPGDAGRRGGQGSHGGDTAGGLAG